MTRKNTFAEKMLNAPAGSIVCAEPDLILSHDNSARVRKLFEKMGGLDIRYPEKLLVVLDRKMMGTTDLLVRDYNSIHHFMKEQEVERFFDCDKGICHEVLTHFIHQGMLVVGSDSHTCTAGAFNCMAVGLNKTETAYLWKEGKMWFRVPETIKIVLEGQFREGVYAKDLALWVMGMLREENPDYCAVEYHGEGVSRLSVSDRMTVANISAEAGFKLSVFPPDDVLADYFGNYAVQGVWADEKAVYRKEWKLNLGEIVPMMMNTRERNEIKAVEEFKGLEVEQGFIGSCASGRLEDLRVAARILDGRKVATGFQLFIVPASYEIYLEARKEGLIDIFYKAGASVLGASCAPCQGSSHMIQADTKRFLSTTNSNSMNRLSALGVEKYIASPATIAQSALEGKIVPEKGYPDGVFPYWSTPFLPVRIDEFDQRKKKNVWNYSDMDHISCNQLFPEECSYRISQENTEAMKPWLLTGLDKKFASEVEEGDILLAGENFGGGNLIKQAAIGLVAAGIQAIIVKSAARNFFRMACNHGLRMLIAPEIVEAYRPGQEIRLDLENNRVYVETEEFVLPETSAFMAEMIHKKGMAHL